MIQKALLDLLSEKNRGHVVYVHNLNKFDSPYILSELVKMSEKYGLLVKPLVNKGRLLEIVVKRILGRQVGEAVKNSPSGAGARARWVIRFRDSIQLIPGSLRRLSEVFNVEYKKGFFPYKFMTRDNVNYVGPRPDYTYFSGMSREDYELHVPNE